MSKVLIIYYSRHGSIAKMATDVAKGIESINHCEAILRTVPPVSTVCESIAPELPSSGDIYASLEDLTTCDGLIIGSPTRFGSIASPLKYFFDQTASVWLAGGLNGKPAGVFTSSSSMHGGQESTLLSMMVPLLHHGMLLVGLPFSNSALSHTQSGGTPYGASHIAGANNTQPISKEESTLNMLLGQRVAKASVALGQVEF